MQDERLPNRIPLSKILLVLIGFPIIATLISLLLINRSLITDFGIDFFNTFWIIIIFWYMIQIYFISKILKSSNRSWTDIGISKKRIVYYIIGYFIFAFALLTFIELALYNSVVDTDKLNSISSLTPKTFTSRVIFIIMAFVAGLAEEIVYRGFAIKSLITNKVNRWLGVFIAAIPFIFQHGLKSIDQFWWFLITGVIFGIIYVSRKNLYLNIVIHWLVILSAMIGIFQAIE